MTKRMMLVLTFVAALGFGALGAASPASAHGGCYRGGGHGYGGYGGYGPAVTYRSYYGPRYYGPTVYPSYYRGYSGYGGAYIPLGRRSGLSFSIGF